jgi:site-specific DNA-methyltransferase (adenine-specific)
MDITAPATPAARQWQGWGTALKPALEPITMARKPFPGTVAANVMQHGTGAVNVDGCRVGTEQTTTVRNGNSGAHGRYGKDERVFERVNPPGRWPANLIHDGSDEVLAGFPECGKAGVAHEANAKPNDGYSGGWKRLARTVTHGDSGSAARFFYCPKASKADREAGLEGVTAVFAPTMGNGIGGKEHDPQTATPKTNPHPTVKPTALMQYLCRLVTPPGGTVLDPFCGSGSTGKAAMLEGFNFVGFEREAEYVEIARRRIAEAAARPMLEGIK